MVYRICNFSVSDRNCNPEQKTYFQEKTWKISPYSHPVNRNPDSQLPFTSFAVLFGFKPLPVSVILILGAIVGLYILTAEIVKKIFYKKVKF